jgi:hypothetical protein
MGQVYEVDAATGNEKISGALAIGGALTVGGVVNANGGITGTLNGSAATLANTTAAGNSAITAINAADAGTVPIAHGGSGASTQQEAINALTNVAASSPNFVLSNVNGDATWQAVIAQAADTLDTFHASSTPTANTILPLDANVKYPNTVLMTGSGNGLDADTVDGVHAAAAATANKLLALDASAKFPNSALYTGSGNGLDADTVDGHNAPATDAVPAAGQLLVVRSDGKCPAIDGSLITNLSISALPAIPYWIKANSISHTAFGNATGLYSINMALTASIPPGGCIHAVKIKASEAFSGSGITSVTVGVGNASTVAKYATPFELTTGVSSTNFQLTNELFGEDHLAATPCVATFTSAGATLDQLVAGSGVVDIWVMVSQAI